MRNSRDGCDTPYSLSEKERACHRKPRGAPPQTLCLMLMMGGPVKLLPTQLTAAILNKEEALTYTQLRGRLSKTK